MANGRLNGRKNRFDRGYLKGFRWKSLLEKKELYQALNNGRKMINSDGLFSPDISLGDIARIRFVLEKMELSDIQVIYPDWIADMLEPAIGK